MKLLLEFTLETSKYKLIVTLLVQCKLHVRESATNLEFLRSLEISHVLNSAEGKKPGCVDTSQEGETRLGGSL